MTWCVCPALWIPAYAGMTVRDTLNDGAGVFCSPSPLIPLPSRRPLQNLPSFPPTRESTMKTQLGRLRILANYRCSSEFCKGLHQGRGDMVGCFVLLYAPRHMSPLWIADQVRNDVTMRCIVFTLTLALSHQGRGDSVGCVVSRVTRHPSGLGIKSAMTGEDVWSMVVVFHF